MTKKKFSKFATTVTPFSKFLAMALFILFPLVGFYLGIQYQKLQEKVTTPILSPLVQQIPDKLVIMKAQYTHETTAIALKVIEDKNEVGKFYNEINNLPLMTDGIVNCPADAGREYILDFSLKGELIMHAVVNPTGCQTVTIQGKHTRTALWENGHIFLQDLQHVLNLSTDDFYGMHRTTP